MMHIWILVPVILDAVSPLLAFEVICKPNTLKKFVGNNTSLRCFCKCESKCAVKRIIWTKDDNILHKHPPTKNQNNQTANRRFQFMYQNIENGNISVNIKNLQNSDAGTYKCTIVINGAFRQGTINLQVSDPNLNKEDPTRHYAFAGAGAFLFVITGLAFVPCNKRLGCRHFQKKNKLPNTGDGEEFNNSSTGSDSSKSELIKKSLNLDGTDKKC